MLINGRQAGWLTDWLAGWAKYSILKTSLDLTTTDKQRTEIACLQRPIYFCVNIAVVVVVVGGSVVVS